jgi:hypothetical protein
LPIFPKLSRFFTHSEEIYESIASILISLQQIDSICHCELPP